jgi:hypothetical protein
MPELPGSPLPRADTELHPWDPPLARKAFGEAHFHEIVALTAEADPRVVLSRPSDLLVIGRVAQGCSRHSTSAARQSGCFCILRHRC